MCPIEYNARSRRRRKIKNRIMKWLRRIHLYSGLFMLPWVLLYGVTALLFNHPTSFSPWEGTRFSAPPGDDDPFASLPGPRELAAGIARELDRIAAAAGNTDGTEESPPVVFKVVDSRPVRFDGEFIVEASGDGVLHRLRVDPARGNGVFVSHRTEGSTSAEADPEAGAEAGNESEGAGDEGAGDGGAGEPVEPASFVRDGIALSMPYAETLAADAGRVLQQHGRDYDALGLRFVPELRFDIEAHGKLWHARYQVDTNTLSGMEVIGPQPGIGLRDFLTELHLAHGYPTNIKARWIWALIVDAMFVAMAFWAVSGLLMWLQIGSVRWKGAAFLIASAALTIYITWAMYGEISFITR